MLPCSSVTFLGLMLLGLVSSEMKRVCYYKSWAKYRASPNTPFSPDLINASLCTHIIYAFATLKDNDIYMSEDDDDTLQKLRDLRNANPNLMIMLSVGGYAQGTAEFIKTASSTEGILEFASNALLYLRLYNFDGLDLDWEFPGDQGASHKDHFTDLVKGMMDVFKIEAKVMDTTRVLLSATVSAYSPIVDNSYDAAAISQYLDMINLMAYDMQGTSNEETRFNSPLYGLTSDTGTDVYRNQDYAVQHWLNNGAIRSKLVMGLATYGRTFTLTDASQYGVGDPASGPGLPGQYTQKQGLLAYYEICENLNSGWGRIMDTVQDVPLAWYGDQWVGYDDVESLTLKANYIVNNGLAGAMFWLDYDDYDNVCGQGVFPLINSVKSVFESSTPSVPTTNAPPVVTQTPSTSKPTTPIPTTTTQRPTTTTKTPTTTTKKPTTTTPRPTTTMPPTTQQPAGCTAPVCNGASFMADPCNPKRYYQCGAGGQVWHMSCNSVLVWNQSIKNCAWTARRSLVDGSKHQQRKVQRKEELPPYPIKPIKERTNTPIKEEKTSEERGKLMNELRHLLRLVKSDAETEHPSEKRRP